MTDEERVLLLLVAQAVRHLMAIHPSGALSSWRQELSIAIEKLIQSREIKDENQG